MLCLTKEIGCADLRVDRVVGDNERFRGTGRQVDADATVKLSLRLGNKGIARTHDDVNRIDKLGADRKRSDRLDATEEIDLVSTGEVHCGDRLVGHGAVDRRGARSDTGYTCDLGREHTHVR